MKKYAFLLPALLIITGCASQQTAYSERAAGYFPDTAAAVSAPKMKSTRFSGARRSNSVRLAKNSSDSAAYDFKAPAGRKMTYTTRMTISVPDTVQGVKKASSIARKYNGYTVFSDNTTANLKIPVANAAAALKDFDAVGTITAKTVTANDITEHYTDTKVRLDNLRRLQKRLSELLSRATKVEDILRIERELSRVTTDLERYQARMNVLTKQVEMVDFYLSFNASVAPSQISRRIIPVEWVRSLGAAIRNESFNYTGVVDDKPAEFALPAGFAITYGTENSLKAANAENTVLKLGKFNNMPSADLDFYKNLIEKQLKFSGYGNIVFKQGKCADGTVYLAVTAVSGADTFVAMAAICDDGWICEDLKVAVLEVFGPTADVKKIDTDKLFTSFKF